MNDKSSYWGSPLKHIYPESIILGCRPHCIIAAKKAFTIGEELILPVTKDICHEPFGEDEVKKVANVLPSATTIRKIDKIADDVVQLLARINESLCYAIQVDDSIDVDNKAIFLIFVQYIFQEDVH